MNFDSFVLVYLGKIDYTKAPLPIEESNCFAIPLEVIDKNVAYEIVLEMNNRVC